MGIIDRCEFRSRSGGVAVVVCPPGLADHALRLIGRTACQGEQHGTAWLWDDPALAPELPPTVDHPMTEAQADAVAAIYIADTGRLCRASAAAGVWRSALEPRQPALHHLDQGLKPMVARFPR